MSMNLPNWYNDWLTHLQANLPREKSQKDYDRRVRGLLESGLSVEQYILQPYDSQTGVGGPERNVRRSAMVCFRKFCHRHKIGGFFGDDFEMPKALTNTARKPVYLSQQEQMTLLELVRTDFPRREYIIMLLAYSLALRAGDIRGLRLCDVRLDCEKPHVYIVNGKGGNDDTVYMDSYTEERLREYLEWREPLNPAKDSYLILGQRGGQYPKGFEPFIKVEREAFDKLGLPQPSRPMHNHRHMRCTHLAEAGMPVEDRQSMLRHKHLTTTQMYDHRNRVRLHDELEKFSPFAEAAEAMIGEPRRIDVSHLWSRQPRTVKRERGKTARNVAAYSQFVLLSANYEGKPPMKENAG